MNGLQIFLALGLLIGSPVRAGEDKVKPKVLVIFNFDAPDRELGEKLADQLWRKIKRNKTNRLVLVDMLTAGDVEEALAKGRFSAESSPIEVAKVLKEQLAADLAVWGTLAGVRGDYRLHFKAIDLTRGPELWLDESVSGQGERALRLIIDQVAEKILGRPVWKPEEAPGVGEPEPPETGPLVSPNPSFEKGRNTPAGWEPVDGLGTFWIKTPGRKGKCLAIDTAIDEKEYLAWRRRFESGAPASKAPCKSRNDTSYGCIGGTYGIHFYTTEFIPIKEAMRYRISCDIKGTSGDFFFPKIFVKGYRKFKGRKGFDDQMRMVYETYLSCRLLKGDWGHYWLRFTPHRRAGRIPAHQLKKPTHLKIMIYAYWPPGTYLFDNVRLTEDPPRSVRFRTGD